MVVCETVLCKIVLCAMVLCETVTTQCFITPYLEYLEFHWKLKICKDKPWANFLVKSVSKEQCITRRHLGFRWLGTLCMNYFSVVFVTRVNFVKYRKPTRCVSYRKILIFFRFYVARHVFRPIWFKARWRRILLHWSRWDSLSVYLELPSNRAARCSRRQDRSQGVVNWSWVLSSPRNYRWA